MKKMQNIETKSAFTPSFKLFLKIKNKKPIEKKKKKNLCFYQKSYLPCYIYILNVYIYKSNILQINFFFKHPQVYPKKKN